MTAKPWTRPDWIGPSAFPPCAICGNRYEGHEVTGRDGQRGHRIDSPWRAEHGDYHDFTPMPLDTPLTDEREAQECDPSSGCGLPRREPDLDLTPEEIEALRDDALGAISKVIARALVRYAARKAGECARKEV